MSTTRRNHWLQQVAAHAGLELSLPETPSRQQLEQAWPRVVDACGISDEVFTKRAAAYFRIGIADPGSYHPQAVKLIPEAVARRYGILALSATQETLVVAALDPVNQSAQREIQACAGRQPIFAMTSPTKLAPALERAYAPARAPRNALQTLVSDVDSSDFRIVTHQGSGVVVTGFELEDPPLVKLTRMLLEQALRHRASEIHLEPKSQKQGRVRFRVDGVLQTFLELPATAYQRVVARLKHLATTQPDATLDEGFPVSSGGTEVRARLWNTPTPDGSNSSRSRCNTSQSVDCTGSGRKRRVRSTSPGNPFRR